MVHLSWSTDIRIGSSSPMASNMVGLSQHSVSPIRAAMGGHREGLGGGGGYLGGYGERLAVTRNDRLAGLSTIPMVSTCGSVSWCGPAGWELSRLSSTRQRGNRGEAAFSICDQG